VLEVSPLVSLVRYRNNQIRIWTCMFKMRKVFWNTVGIKYENYFYFQASMKISILVKSLVFFLQLCHEGIFWWVLSLFFYPRWTTSLTGQTLFWRIILSEWDMISWYIFPFFYSTLEKLPAAFQLDLNWGLFKQRALHNVTTRL
jgi:hypothetical protein